MGRMWQNAVLLLGVWAVAQTIVGTPAQAQLDPNFYDDKCIEVFPIVAARVLVGITKEPRIAGSLLRMHFHDCFVQGCDASLLIDGPQTEKTTPPNRNSLRGFEVIDDIKALVEKTCPNVVSCADIITLSAFFSVVLTGGPTWTVPLGRRDSPNPAPQLAGNLPAPFFNVATLQSAFQKQGLSTTDLVALSGGHTIGKAKCATYFTRLYNFSATDRPDPTLSSGLLQKLRLLCGPPDSVGNPIDGNHGNITTGLDLQTQNGFDNSYFKNLLANNGLLQSDQELFSSNNQTKALVKKYALTQSLFFDDFVQGMLKMGNLNVSTGSSGEIRKNCHVANSPSQNAAVFLRERAPQRKVSPVEVESDAQLDQMFHEKVMNAIDRAVTDLLDGTLANPEWQVEDIEPTVTHSSF